MIGTLFNIVIGHAISVRCTAGNHAFCVQCVWKIARIIPEYVQPPDHDGFRHKPLKVGLI